MAVDGQAMVKFGFKKLYGTDCTLCSKWKIVQNKSREKLLTMMVPMTILTMNTALPMFDKKLSACTCYRASGNNNGKAKR